MDSHYFDYSVAGAGISYSSYSNASSIPTTMLTSFEFDSLNSTNWPFSTPFDTDTISRNSDSQESSSSSLDHNIYFQQSGASPFRLQDSSLLNFIEPSFHKNIDGNHHIKHALQELESALMAADDYEKVIRSSPFLGETMLSHSHQLEPHHDSWFHSSNNEHRVHKLHRDMVDDFASGGPPNTLKWLLIACAEVLSENKLDEFEKLVGQVRAAVSISGEPIQRLGAYMLEGLIARKESSGTNIYRALNCNEPDSNDLLSYMHILYEVCPYLKFSYMAANGAIAEACKKEDRIHIVDFQIAQGRQWMTLLQALAARPGGPPHVRITGIDDPVSRYARGDGLAVVGERLAAISKKFNIPVEFHGVPVFASDVTREMLDVRAGEALAVNFALQLHHTPDESVHVSNPRDGLLRMVKSLSPKVVTLVEQESNTNTAAFLPRFVETLDFYSAMFESLDVMTTRGRRDRINVEQHCLARDIVNVIACEGRERVERHELFGKWRLRFMMAGFRQFGLSSYVNSVIRGLLKSYSEHYTLLEKDGALLLGWKGRNLFSASAWQ